MVNSELKYSKPMVEVVTISSEDIITTSTDNEFDIVDLLSGQLGRS